MYRPYFRLLFVWVPVPVPVPYLSRNGETVITRP